MLRRLSVLSLLMLTACGAAHAQSDPPSKPIPPPPPPHKPVRRLPTHRPRQAVAPRATTTTAQPVQPPKGATHSVPQSPPVRTSSPDSQLSTPTPTNVGSTSSDAFLACTRSHESDSAGGYAAVSPDGVYRGAYQFLRSTWDNVARMAGRSDLVGVDPAQASPASQDELALALYHSQGAAPWGGRCAGLP